MHRFEVNFKHGFIPASTYAQNRDNWLAALCAVRKFIIDYLHIEPLSFGIILLLISSIALFSLTMPIICCYNRRKDGSAHCSSNAKDYRLSPSKDPTMLMDGVLSDPSVSNNNNTADNAGETVKAKVKNVLFPPPSPSAFRREEERSPPPPRRSVSGKTMIVPLCNTRPIARQPLIVPVGSRAVISSSLEGNALCAKSCETIPEDNELEFETISEVSREDGTDRTSITEDLLSIDRTYISTNDLFINAFFTKTQLCYAPKLIFVVYKSAVDNKIPTPTYSPPAPPQVAPYTMSIKQVDIIQTGNKPPENVTDPSLVGGCSNLSSPEPSSSYGGQLDSPIDTTTGSLSDNFLMPDLDAVERGYARQQHGYCHKQPQEDNGIMVSELDLSSSVDNKYAYALHKIEEESEHLVGSRCLGVLPSCPIMDHVVSTEEIITTVTVKNSFLDRFLNS
uniref:Uncharacterized protein n=1 Tax=Ditylenchus dipsaci TaxID=166011 RepID=A0A915EJR5_9BILA